MNGNYPFIYRPEMQEKMFIFVGSLPFSSLGLIILIVFFISGCHSYRNNMFLDQGLCCSADVTVMEIILFGK